MRRQHTVSIMLQAFYVCEECFFADRHIDFLIDQAGMMRYKRNIDL